jgi:hypothetical protein
VSKKLDFIVVGVMKCGTTSLGEYLQQHEEVAIPDWEVGFFTKTKRFNQGYGYYENYVDEYATEKTVSRGEKTPYSFDKKITPMIHAYNPDIKLVFIFRNPTARAWSNYGHDLWNLYEHKSFGKCIEQEEERDVLYQYLSKGRYAEQIEDYLQYFKREQMMFLLFEDFIADKEATLRKVFSFLEVNPDNYDYTIDIHSKKSYHPRRNIRFLIWFKKVFGTKNFLWGKLWWFHFKGNNKKKIPQDTKQKLDAYYAPYNEELASKFGVDISKWK